MVELHDATTGAEIILVEDLSLYLRLLDRRAMTEPFHSAASSTGRGGEAFAAPPGP